MTMIYLYLTDRELDAVRVPIGDGVTNPNAQLLRTLQAKLDVRQKEILLTTLELSAVQHAVRNWEFGYERAFKALLAAANRAPTH